MLMEYLAGEGIETDAVHNGEDGVTAALSGAYAAVILDIMLPRLDGVEVLRRVRQDSAVPIIMLTAKGDNVDRVVGLEMGADDYLPKPVYPRELLARLRAILRRTDAQAPRKPSSVVTQGDLQLSPARRTTEWRGAAIELTASEFNLLEALMRAEGDVVSKNDLSRRALGRVHEAYDRSVDVHIANLRQKLAAVADQGVEIQTARGIGYSLHVKS